MNVIARSSCFMSREKALLAASVASSLQCRSIKHNIKHPRPVHMERRLMEAVTQPVHPNKLNNMGRVCSVMERDDLDMFAPRPSVSQKEMYEAFVVREAKKIFESNNMIIAFQPEALDGRKKTQICNKLHAAGFSAVFYPIDLLRQAVDLSKWQNMTLLLQSETVVVVSQDSRVPELLNITKKIPELILLGGFVDDVLLTREGLARYARLPSINELHCELSTVLSLSLNSSRNSLEMQQRSLLNNLDSHRKQRIADES